MPCAIGERYDRYTVSIKVEANGVGTVLMTDLSKTEIVKSASSLEAGIRSMYNRDMYIIRPSFRLEGSYLFVNGIFVIRS